ncbi:hypothetical protein, partial [Enterobacter mori]
ASLLEPDAGVSRHFLAARHPGLNQTRHRPLGSHEKDTDAKKVRFSKRDALIFKKHLNSNRRRARQPESACGAQTHVYKILL